MAGRGLSRMQRIDNLVPGNEKIKTPSIHILQGNWHRNLQNENWKIGNHTSCTIPNLPRNEDLRQGRNVRFRYNGSGDEDFRKADKLLKIQQQPYRKSYAKGLSIQRK